MEVVIDQKGEETVIKIKGMRNVVRETFSLTGFNALFKIEDAK